MREQDFLKAIAEGGKAAGDEGHKGIGIDQQVLAGKPVPSATLQPASPDVPPAAEPASAAADVDIKGIRGIRRRNQRQKPTVSKTAAPAAAAAEPAVKAESIPGSQAEPAIASGAEKSEEEKKKDFVESVPNGEVICLINKTTGARAYYRRLNGNFLKGQSLGKHKIWATEEA